MYLLLLIIEPLGYSACVFLSYQLALPEYL